MARATSPAVSPVISQGMRVALVVLGGFTTVTATGGGLALAADIERSRLPIELLLGTPFSSYLVPGLTLAVAVGGSAAAATAATLCSRWLGPRLFTLAGAILVGWIVGEVIILQAPQARSWMEAAYLLVGLSMAGLGLACWLTERGGGERPRLGPDPEGEEDRPRVIPPTAR